MNRPDAGDPGERTGRDAAMGTREDDSGRSGLSASAGTAAGVAGATATTAAGHATSPATAGHGTTGPATAAQRRERINHMPGAGTARADAITVDPVFYSPTPRPPAQYPRRPV